MQFGVDSLVDLLKAAGEPTRLRLLALLAAGDLTVTDLTEILGQSQPRISRHLKLLDRSRVDRPLSGRCLGLFPPQAGRGASSLIRMLLDVTEDADPCCCVTGTDWPPSNGQGREAQEYFSRNASNGTSYDGCM